MSVVDDFCRFDPLEHAYYDRAGVRVPSVTQMLDRCGYIKSDYYTEESAERGTRVHELATALDLGALDLESCVSYYKPWLLPYREVTARLRPTWEEIEIASIHPAYRFGGRPDRVGRVFNVRTIAELKSNGMSGWNVEDWHSLQTALQAILVSARHPLPAEAWARMAIYLRPNGKYRVEHHRNKRDFDKAYEIIRHCTR